MKRSKTPKRRAKKAVKRSVARKKTRKVDKKKVKKKRGPVSFRSTSKLFRSAGHRTQLQHLRNELRSDECLETSFSRNSALGGNCEEEHGHGSLTGNSDFEIGVNLSYHREFLKLLHERTICKESVTGNS